MSLNLPDGFGGGGTEDDNDNQVPIFDVQKVGLNFNISASFVAAAVSNSVLVLALSTNRILRFDLDSPGDIDDIDLPKRVAEVGIIRKLFLDPTASHLLISTATGENFYLHSQSRQVKQLARLKGVQIDCVAWCPDLPTSSTREILVGAADGDVIEVLVEPSSGSRERVRIVYHVQEGSGVIGIFADALGGAGAEARRVLVATKDRLLHFAGRTSSMAGGGLIRRHEGNTAYARLFESEAPAVHEVERMAAGTFASCLAITPDKPATSSASTDAASMDKAYAWLCSQGIFHGKLLTSAPDPIALGKQIYRESSLFPSSKLPPLSTASEFSRGSQPHISAMLLTRWHVLALMQGRITALNRLDSSIVFNQQILEPGQTSIGLFADHQNGTYWLFTDQEIFEIVAKDEGRHIWKIMLQQGHYELAQQYADTSEQKDEIASKLGDHLISQRKFDEAAIVLGRSSKAFEDVALCFIDHAEQDALRKYLSVKLSTLKTSNVMQRIMLASWLVELYMAKLNQLDDTISSRAELTAEGSTATSADTERQLPLVRRDFQSFASKHKADLDRKTIYEIISAHGREEELLFFANVIEDYDYVLTYWVQRERWDEAMSVLKKQTTPQMFYRYSTVLMTHRASELIDVLMRQGNLDDKRIIPALLSYNKTHATSVPMNQNQAIRYLQFCINHHHSTEPVVHNTLISIYASHPTPDESALLAYLKTQEAAREQNYDVDFALRLCIAHKRVQSAVHVYGTMQQFAPAVDLALKYDKVELAANIADRPGNDDVLRKKLWLKVAKKVIGQSKGIRPAIEFLKGCKLLRIEDLIPFFPDFVIIDDFKEEICAALEEYSTHIAELKKAMDDAAATANHIKADIKNLDHRYAIVEPGERCWKCRFPLLQRQFFVFPCQHAFHADCLGEMVLKGGGSGKGKRIRELQKDIGRGIASEKRREGMTRDLDALVAGTCVLCGDLAVKMIDEPFFTEAEDAEGEWDV